MLTILAESMTDWFEFLLLMLFVLKMSIGLANHDFQ